MNTNIDQIRKLKKVDDTATPCTAHTVAEASRPFRQFKRELVKDPLENRGHPKSTTSTRSKKAKYVNWQQPALWNQILDACDFVGWPWEPTRIAQRVRAVNPRSFSTFRPQRISDWRDKRFSDRLVWKENVQQRALAGNRVRGSVTCEGILVSWLFMMLGVKY